MFKVVERTVGILGSVLLFALMILTFVDVVGRSMFNRPLAGASELTEVLLAVIIFLMLPIVAYRGQHIAVDMIDGVIGRRMRAALDVLSAIACAGFFGLVAWRMWVLGDRALSYHDASPILGIPYAPVLYGVAVLSVGSAVAFLCSIPGFLFRRTDERAESPTIV